MRGGELRDRDDLCRQGRPRLHGGNDERATRSAGATGKKTQPYTTRIAHKGIWVEPELLAEIEYRAKSAAGKVRHPFFKGLREDIG
jgi:ATP-dependent DNA ligase